LGKTVPLFFMKQITQNEAANYVQKLLIERGFNVASHKLTNQWIVFEHQGKQVGIDRKAGVWIKEPEHEWRCLAVPCTVSGAIQAVDFLAKEELVR
jgi:hypothetical protein